MSHFEYIDPKIIMLLIFTIGLVFGSFATMASYRIPKKEDIIFKPSRCPKCQYRLKAIDLIPVLSWLFNKGKCRNCKAKISARYPIIEIVTACLFCISAYITNFTLYSIVLCFISLCLVIWATYLLEKPRQC